MGHLWLNPEDKQFWKFCFDDISKNDVPAFLDYIVRFTGFSKCELPNAVFNLKRHIFAEKVHVIGHSQGTSVIFALLSQSQEYDHTIETFIAISPITRIKNARTLFKRVISMLQSRFKSVVGCVISPFSLFVAYLL